MNIQKCPKCGKNQVESEECIHCGIIIHKYTASMKQDRTIDASRADQDKDVKNNASISGRSVETGFRSRNTAGGSPFSKKFSPGMSGLFIVILAMICFFMMYRDKDKIVTSAEAGTITLPDAYEASKTFAREKLDESEIIKFQDYNEDSRIHYDNEASVREIEKGAFQIDSCIEAKDRSGVIQNLKYSCIIEYSGRNRWKLVNIDISKCQ